MAVQFEDECVGCPPEMGCLGSACRYRDVPHFYCDECGEELDDDDIYEVDGKMFCSECCLKACKAEANDFL